MTGCHLPSNTDYCLNTHMAQCLELGTHGRNSFLVLTNEVKKLFGWDRDMLGGDHRCGIKQSANRKFMRSLPRLPQVPEKISTAYKKEGKYSHIYLFQPCIGNCLLHCYIIYTRTERSVTCESKLAVKPEIDLNTSERTKFLYYLI